MDKLYHEFGPEGTNDLMIFFVDGDPASSMALLEGASGSQGDWTNGGTTPYPIIGPNGQGSALADIYNISAYPTLFMHCPGASQGVVINRQSTWTAFFQSWRNACPAAFNNGATDATLLTADSGVLCPGEYPKATLYNQGTSTLTSATLELMDASSNVLQTVNWTGSLPRWGSAAVTFNDVVVTDPVDFTAAVSMPNGVEDTNTLGDEEEYAFESAPEALYSLVNFEIRTDNYAEETSWKLYNSANQVVQQFGPYTATTQDNTTFNYNWTLNPAECYRLEVLDAYGDGICCTYGNGFYKVRSGGVIVTEGAQFGAVAKEPFAAGLSTSVTENVLEKGFNLYPNPTNGQLNVTVNLETAATVRITVMNVIGEMVYSTTKGFNAGAQQSTLDLSSLPNGSYMVNILADGMTATRKVTVNQ